MKKAVLSAAFICLVHIVNAQTNETCLSDFGLKGNVKEIIDFVYRGYFNQNNVDSAKSPEKNIIKFDKNGNELDAYSYDRRGRLSAKFVFSYENSKTLVKKSYDANGALQGEYIFKYDDKGNQIEMDTYYDIDLKLLNSLIYKYDKSGNRVEEDTYNAAGGLTEKAIYHFNENGQVAEQNQGWYMPNSSKIQKVLFKYDSAGNKTTDYTYDLNGQLTGESNISYNNLDGHGNWQLKLTVLKGHTGWQGDFFFRNIVKRHIKYFLKVLPN